MFLEKTPICLALLGLLAVAVAHGEENDTWPGLNECLLQCVEPDAPEQGMSLGDYAKNLGKTDSELAGDLVSIVARELAKSPDAVNTHLAKSALWGLVEVGGEKESAFVREVMQTQSDYFRHVAIHVGIRMAPGQWEDWVREIATDKRYSDYDRFLAYAEAFQVGREVDRETRKHVVEVLKGLRHNDSCRSNRNRLGLWIAELDGDNWEGWMREVVSAEEFRDSDRYGAYEWAFRIGRDGDDATRRHVLNVLQEMREKETLPMNRSQLERWIAELGDGP